MKVAPQMILASLLLSGFPQSAVAQFDPTPAEPDTARLLPEAEPIALPGESGMLGEQPPTFLSKDWQKDSADNRAKPEVETVMQCRDGVDDNGDPTRICTSVPAPKAKDQ